MPRRAWLPLELTIVAALIFVYGRIRALADTRTSLSLHDGLQVLAAERHLGLDFELPMNLWLAGHHQLSEISSWYYQLAHLSVTLSVLVACFIYRPDIYRAARNALVLINVIALAVFWVYPVAPPRLLPGGRYIDVTQMTGVATASSTAAPNLYAAMPSLHTAWAVWAVVIVFLMVRVWWVRALSVVHPVLTVAVIIATGNHYFLDTVAGAAVTLAAAAAVGLLPGSRWFEPDRRAMATNPIG